MLRDLGVEDARGSELQANNPHYDEQCGDAIDHQHRDLLGHVALVDGVVVGADRYLQRQRSTTQLTLPLA